MVGAIYHKQLGEMVLLCSVSLADVGGSIAVYCQDLSWIPAYYSSTNVGKSSELRMAGRSEGYFEEYNPDRKRFARNVDASKNIRQVMWLQPLPRTLWKEEIRFPKMNSLLR